MDFFDFLNVTGTAGTRRVRILTGVIGLVLGAGLGGLYGAEMIGSAMAPLLYGVIGAVLGGGLGALFSGYILFGLIAAVFIAVAVVWQVFFKAA